MLVDNLSSLLRELSVRPRALLLEIFNSLLARGNLPLEGSSHSTGVCWIQLIGGCSFNITILAH